MIVRRFRVATWVALPALGMLARRSPKTAGVIATLLTGTIGIAHGANDDRILAELAPSIPGKRVTISAVYALIAAGVFAATRKRPLATERALKALAWYHFGAGDAALAHACGSRHCGAIATFARGAVPLQIGSSAGSRGKLAIALAYAGSMAVRGDLPDALDLAIPAFTLSLAPEPLGFAAYFAAWHSPRHMALLLERDTRGGSLWLRSKRYVSDTARNYGISMLLGALAFAVLRDEDPHDLINAITLAITVPHQAVVWYAERTARALSNESGRG